MKNLSFFILLRLSVSIISCKKDENGGVAKKWLFLHIIQNG